MFQDFVPGFLPLGRVFNTRWLLENAPADLLRRENGIYRLNIEVAAQMFTQAHAAKLKLPAGTSEAEVRTHSKLIHGDEAFVLPAHDALVCQCLNADFAVVYAQVCSQTG